MNDSHKSENQQLSAALAQMSGTEVAQMIDTIAALQVDLLRLLPLFNGEEPVEAVTYTQYLLKILADDMNQILAIKPMRDIQDHAQNSNNESPGVDYTPAFRLLSKMQGNKRRLTWAGMNGAQ
jgi:hypothetical protein